MPGKSQAHSDSVLNVLRNVALAAIAAPHIGLIRQDTGAELAGNGYARQPVTFGAPVAAPEVSTDARKVSNTNTLTFGPATADWPAADRFIVTDGAAGATVYGPESLLDPLGNPVVKTVQNGDSANCAAGAVVVKED